MSIVQHIQQAVVKSLTDLYQQNFTSSDFQVNQTKPEFEGDYTIVLFSLVKTLKQSPDAIGKTLGDQLLEQHPELFTRYNLIKGFLNLSIADQYWMNLLHRHHNDAGYGRKASNGSKVMVEYSSPNTNKPLHLGHLRNNFLGWSVSELLKANGYEVIKSAIVNDRGIHICKSMLSWQKYGNGATPASTGMKGDHFVGDYYVKFENDLRAQTAPLLQQLLAGDCSSLPAAEADKATAMLRNMASLDVEKDAEKISRIKDDLHELARANTPIMAEAKQMLVDWEQGKPEVIELWKKMNGWVYEGFGMTYATIGSDFDITYYESDTYLLGKNIVQEGLDKSVFYRKEDGSIWIDLTGDGLDEKLVQRKDGTSVYITQDIGLAKLKYDQYGIDQSIYVIGNEQNYHMKVLQLICEKLGMPNAKGIYHLSYGMVELTTGKMKSREGTVVDADDLVKEMEEKAAEETARHGKTGTFNPEELQELYTMIALGALKFYLLRVDPKKTMVFDPKESVDIHGFTGPFIQYTHARICSILRKVGSLPGSDYVHTSETLLPLEIELIVLLEKYPAVLEQACLEHNPSVVAGYSFQLAQTFNTFYAEHSVANAETTGKKNLRLQLAGMTANVIRSGMQLLGIRVPERM